MRNPYILPKKRLPYLTNIFDILLLNYTLRRFGGLHPLCGTGVTSRIMVIVSPASCNDRNADSRPAPGPFIYTFTLRIPCSFSLRTASYAAICAAKGVLLRDPVSACKPADDHATTL